MDKVHLLIIHPGFCIRAQKQAEALLSKSIYKITIITDINKCGDALSDYLKNNTKVIPFNFHRNIFFRLKFRKMLAKIVNSVDIIHCHNEPNYHIVDTIKVCSGKIPIIYDIHDFTSMRSGRKSQNEKTAYEMSDVIIHVSTDFIYYGEKLYGKKPSQVIFSSPSKKYIVNNDRKHKSDQKEIHFVYQGGIFDPSWKGKKKYSYRNYCPIFTEILNEGHHIHIYTGVNKNRLPSYMILNDQYNNFHFYGKLKYSDLLLEMSNYDFGLAGFNFNNIHSQSAKDYLNAAMGNKMFDYLFSGLPVITFNADAMSNFVKSNNCGFEKKEGITWSHLAHQSINKLEINKVANKYCMENQISVLTKIYENLLN